MVDPIEQSAVYLAIVPGHEPALSTALGAMGMDLPRTGRITEAGGLVLARTAPDHVLAIRAEDESSLMEELAPLSAVARLIDQSDARVMVRVSGPEAVDRLCRLLPIDLHPDQFGPGRCAQTAMSHLTVVVIRRDLETFDILCGRSFAASFARTVNAAMATLAA